MQPYVVTAVTAGSRATCTAVSTGTYPIWQARSIYVPGTSRAILNLPVTSVHCASPVSSSCTVPYCTASLPSCPSSAPVNVPVESADVSRSTTTVVKSPPALDSGASRSFVDEHGLTCPADKYVRVYYFLDCVCLVSESVTLLVGRKWAPSPVVSASRFGGPAIRTNVALNVTASEQNRRPLCAGAPLMGPGQRERRTPRNG